LDPNLTQNECVQHWLVRLWNATGPNAAGRIMRIAAHAIVVSARVARMRRASPGGARFEPGAR
jgi:hypothetical protein